MVPQVAQRAIVRHGEAWHCPAAHLFADAADDERGDVQEKGGTPARCGVGDGFQSKLLHQKTILPTISSVKMLRVSYNGAMQARVLHPWDLDTASAKDLQRTVARRVSHEDEISPSPRLVAGVDISGATRGEEALGAVVILGYPDMELVEVQTVKKRPIIPYVPGLLSFREIPILLEAFQRLRNLPDLILCDGHGYAHPRRFSLACHLGLVLDVPSIGCAKSILVGKYSGLGHSAGSTAALMDKEEPVGLTLRTQDGKSPVFVSLGHNLSIDAAARWVMSCLRRYRLLEPARLAHQVASGRNLPILQPSHRT